MANVLHIVGCAGIVPDPLQTLEPVTGPNGPGLKNEMVLPAVLDPWAACALYEAANLAAKNPGSKLWLVSLGPKAKLQQVMMTVAQKVAFELVPIDGPIGGFPDAHSTAAVLAETIAAIPGLDRSKLLLFGGWESATRGAGVTLQLIGERLGITDQFQGVDQIGLREDVEVDGAEKTIGGAGRMRTRGPVSRSASGREGRDRAERSRTKKLIVAFHFQFSNQAGWRCDVCRKSGLERKRRCGWLPAVEEDGPPGAAYRSLRTCPKSLVTAESQTTVEEFFIRRRLGLKREEYLTARQVEAFAILEKELTAEPVMFLVNTSRFWN